MSCPLPHRPSAWSNLLLLLSHFFTLFTALSSRISFFLMISISTSLLSFSFCFLFPRFHCTVFLFSCSSLSFLKTAILNSSSGKSHIFISLYFVSRKLLWPLLMSWYIDFSNSFNILLLSLKLNSHIPLVLLTSFRKESPSGSPASKSEAFSDLFYMIPAVHFSLQLIAEFLGLYAFFQPCKARSVSGSLLCAFPRMVLHAQVYGFSRTCTVGPEFELVS